MYFMEITDTYGGEANYSWVRRFLVKAKSQRGAITKLGRNTGYQGNRIGHSGEDFQRWDVPKAAICIFSTWVDADAAEHARKHYNLKEL